MTNKAKTKIDKWKFINNTVAEMTQQLTRCIDKPGLNLMK